MRLPPRPPKRTSKKLKNFNRNWRARRKSSRRIWTRKRTRFARKRDEQVAPADEAARSLRVSIRWESGVRSATFTSLQRPIWTRIRNHRAAHEILWPEHPRAARPCLASTFIGAESLSAGHFGEDAAGLQQFLETPLLHRVSIRQHDDAVHRSE